MPREAQRPRRSGARAIVHACKIMQLGHPGGAERGAAGGRPQEMREAERESARAGRRGLGASEGRSAAQPHEHWTGPQMS